ncbi:hypothetical protein SAY87_030532 [Trapa incisa]|uniref:VQ domain-containing protein n=1 Tax=Trapa incisa TaxID=236973 RepID=A0AAN7QNA0_9MYRT|nr:hypothetical protein SAY87_030532 [Trapa incisa]
MEGSPKRREDHIPNMQSPLHHSPIHVIRSGPDGPPSSTFVHADPSVFKQVVQMLTGFSPSHNKKLEATTAGGNNSIPILHLKTAAPKKPGLTPDQPAFRLHERRRSSIKKLSLNALAPSLAQQPSPWKPEVLSLSHLNFPSLSLSPVTPLLIDPFSHPSPALDVKLDEERAIREKGFFLHPSPRSSAITSPQPRLLPLFPLTSSQPSGLE